MNNKRPTGPNVQCKLLKYRIRAQQPEAVTALKSNVTLFPHRQQQYRWWQQQCDLSNVHINLILLDTWHNKHGNSTNSWCQCLSAVGHMTVLHADDNNIENTRWWKYLGFFLENKISLNIVYLYCLALSWYSCCSSPRPSTADTSITLLENTK